MDSQPSIGRLPQVGPGHRAVRAALPLVRAADPAGRRLLVEGIWAHTAVLDSAIPVETFLGCPEAIWSASATELAEAVIERADQAYRISPRTLQRLADRDRADGLVSIAQPCRFQLTDLELGDQSLVLVADGLETPGNLGTLIRTCDACAVDVVIVTDQRTSVWHPKVFRAGHGTTLSVPHVQMPDTESAADWLREQRFQVLLAQAPEDARSGVAAMGYRDVDWMGRTALVVGNERYGISAAWQGHDFDQVTLPMLGRVNSLNVAVAASVLLYEARARQSGW